MTDNFSRASSTCQTTKAPCHKGKVKDIYFIKVSVDKISTFVVCTMGEEEVGGGGGGGGFRNNAL